MCGIVGFSGVNPANVDKLNFLMYYNSVERGKDSTGYYTPETGVKKDAVACLDFLKKNKLPSSNLFIGHVRWKTIGANLTKNAHPFEYDNVVLLHNGTLENHMSMLVKHGFNWKDFDVDSQVLAKLIDENLKSDDYDDKTRFKTLSEFDGAAALLWIDKTNPNKLYVFRNNARPLYCGYIGEEMYISSIEESLKIIGCDKSLIFDQGHLYTVENGAITSKNYYAPYVKTWERQSSSTSNKDEKFIDLISLNHLINNNELLNRWIKCEVEAKNYRKNAFSLTKGRYYFVHDYDATGNWDIKIHDDKGIECTVSKYWFNLDNLTFKQWAILMFNIVDNIDKTKNILIKGEIVKIKDLSHVKRKKDPLIEVLHPLLNTNHFLSIEYLRPANEEEITKKLKELDEHRKNLEAIQAFQEVIGKVDQEELDKLRQNEVNDEQTANNSTINFDKDANSDDDGPDLVETALYLNVLDDISDKVDNIKDITNHLNLDILHNAIEELDNTVLDAYNIDKMLDKYADLEEEEDENCTTCK